MKSAKAEAILPVAEIGLIFDVFRACRRLENGSPEGALYEICEADFIKV